MDQMFEDFSADHANKTITMETHPHLPGPPQVGVLTDQYSILINEITQINSGYLAFWHKSCQDIYLSSNLVQASVHPCKHAQTMKKLLDQVPCRKFCTQQSLFNDNTPKLSFKENIINIKLIDC